jgi:uncharacterized protein (TIGR02466 family)
MRRLSLFPTSVHVVNFARTKPLEEFNGALVARALQLYDQCWRSQPKDALHGRALPGGWRTTANMLFFRQQLAYARERKYAEHLGAFERSREFASLTESMRGAAATYLQAHGMAAAAASSLARDSPLFCWASVHTGGSCHPPHVHSDSCVTGTYYARRPAGAAPIFFEDPRGRSPFDVVVGLESRLRYGSDVADHGASDAVPPFDKGYALEPSAGDCVIFPPWLVHGVPQGPAPTADDDGMPPSDVRVSFSFNLLGTWDHTAKTALPLDMADGA